MTLDGRTTRSTWGPLARPRMLANLRHRMFGAAPRTLRIGPYEVIRELGWGAMGTVFEAVDPRLGRHVALKLVRREGGGPLRHAAVVHEARALARLEHPNVVTVFDAGTCNEGVWVAMELLHGHDLRHIERAGRGVPRIIATLRQLAEALVAVHEAGLVHRDVKPSNVFCTHAGRVCLVDFGLARDTEGFDAMGELASPACAPVSWVVGTPAYMAPEQHCGEAASVAADQYAFSVIAWELLYGASPFVGSDAAALYRAKRAMHLPDRPLRRDVPDGLHRAVVRGLSFDASGRWPSMRDLAAEIAGQSRRGAPLWLALVGLTAIAAAAASVSRGPACDDAPALSWTDRDRELLRAAIVDDGTDLRRDTWTRVEQRVDDTVADYHSIHAETCRAVDDGSITEVVADQRFGCLSSVRRELESVLATLGTGEDDAVEHAVVWLAAIDDPAACTSIDSATSESPPHVPPALAADIGSARDRLAHARDAVRRGEFDDASAAARDAWRVGIELEFEALAAEAELELGRIHRMQREWEPAESFLSAAYFRARAVGHPLVEVRAAMELVDLLAGSLWRTDDASEWLLRARAVQVDAWPSIRVSLLAYDAMVLYQRQDYPGALAASSAALAEAKALPDDVLALTIADNTVVALNGAQRFDEALRLARTTVDERTRILGVDHPSRGRSLQNLGIAAWERGESVEARAAFEASIEIGRAAERRGAHGVGLTLIEFGQRLAHDGDVEGALLRLAEAADILERSLGEDHPAFVTCTFLRGHVQLMAGRHEAAAPLFERALVLAEKNFGSDHVATGWALAGKGRAQLAAADVEAARETLERAWSILSVVETTDPSADLALVRIALADATWRAGGPRALAIELARGARPLVGGSHPSEIANAREVEAWLRSHPPEARG